MLLKINPYEKNDLLRTIEYAKQKKDEDYNEGKITSISYQLDKEKLNQLEQVLLLKKSYEEHPLQSSDLGFEEFL